MYKGAFLLCLGFLLLAAQAQAQEAALTGTVTDPSGAAVVGVDVTATQVERNVTFKTKSGPDGRYLLPRLPIGPY